MLDAALHADPGRLALRERQRRQSLGFPPFGALGTLAGPGADDFAAATGLVSAPLADRVLVRANTWTELADALGSTPRPPGSRVRVAIDPPRE